MFLSVALAWSEAVRTFQPAFLQSGTAAFTRHCAESPGSALGFQAGVGQDHPTNLFEGGFALPDQIQAVAQQGDHA